jgi:hypothetical protein
LTPTDSSLTPTDSSLTPTDSSLTPTDSSLTPTESSLTPTDSSLTSNVGVLIEIPDYLGILGKEMVGDGNGFTPPIEVKYF